MLRGFALMGILIVNVRGFAEASWALSTPASGRVPGAADEWTSALVRLFAEMKFISIFSLLFGAGIAMMSDRMAGRDLSGAGLHRRRHLWLLAIGLAHGFLVWHGDVLSAYAVCGFLVYRLRNLAPRRQLWIGGAAVSTVVLVLGVIWLFVLYLPESGRATMTAEWMPTQEDLDAEIAAFRGAWTDQMPTRASYFALSLVAFPFFVLGHSGGLMLAGMALFRLGVVTGARSTAFYARLAALGFGFGLPPSAWGISVALRPGDETVQALVPQLLLAYIGSVGMFLGYVALVMLIVKRRWLSGLQRRLGAAGRMALTNYIAQSVLCTFVFYGHGLGLFERVSAPGQVGIVAAIWVVQLAWSPWWLARYRFGPLEWFWRSATYRRWQPMRAAAKTSQ